MRTARLLMLLVAFGATGAVFASQEGVLVLGAFRVESPGIGESGPVVVSGTRNSKGIENLRVEAFGKQFNLTQEQLKSLSGVLVNGLQLSYEGGYRELGGRTLYLLFSMGFTSGITQRRFVVITENGSVKIGAKP